MFKYLKESGCFNLPKLLGSNWTKLYTSGEAFDSTFNAETGT